MATISEESPVLEKTRELCASILDEPEFASHLENVTAFIEDTEARTQFIQLSQKRDELQHKQQNGSAPDMEEVREFQTLQASLMENGVIKNFLEAQEELNNLHATISEFIAKTLELRRVPEKDDFESEGGCGEGCGCH